MTIELPAGSRGPARGPGDQDELIQLFQNLIHNAIKYGRAGSPVRVRGPGQRAAGGHDPGPAGRGGARSSTMARASPAGICRA